jgi:hypothetical protein
MAILLGVGLVTLAGWGTGLLFPVVGLFLLLTFFFGLADSPVELFILTCAMIVAPLMARFVAHLMNPLFVRETPASLLTLLVTFFLLAIISDQQVVRLFSFIAQGNHSINLTAMSGFVAESLYISALVGATLLLVIALLEMPLHWFFGPQSYRSIDWVAALRPLLLIIIVMGCASEISELLIDSLSRATSALYKESAS